MSSSTTATISAFKKGSAHEDLIKMLLRNSDTMPCSTVARVYDEIVPRSDRFHVALNVVLPCLLLENNYNARILAAYLLYSIYVPHPLEINPFKEALEENLTKAKSSSSLADPQFIWALNKILGGQGSDLDPLSPTDITTTHGSLNGIGFSSNDSPASDIIDHTLRPENNYPVATTEPRPSESPDENAQELLQQPPSLQNNVDVNDFEEALSKAVILLLTARTRVLTLSETRMLKPFLNTLATPLPVLKASDLPALISFNPNLAHLMFAQLVVAHPEQWPAYVEMLISLTPSPSTLDFFGWVLQDATLLHDTKSTVADQVRIEALGGFVHSSVEWIEKREAEATQIDGEQVGDSLVKISVDLCRFYSNMVKLSLVDASSDIENAEMITFALRHSHLEEANSLYRMLATGRAG